MWNHLLHTGAFWLTVLLLVALILAKDIYISGLERNFNFKPWHIIQEVRVYSLFMLNLQLPYYAVHVCI